jgi:hypothetical protein
MNIPPESLPATVKKIFNLKDDFLTARDAWAGTFEHILSQRTSPRKDCPSMKPLQGVKLKGYYPYFGVQPFTFPSKYFATLQKGRGNFL